MKDQSQKIAPPTSLKNRERGFSVLELILVLTVIGIVSSFAYVRLAAAREVMRVTNSSREFTNFVQKARLDSIRRHPPTNGAVPATVTVNDATTYTVTGDFDGNGVANSLKQLQQGVSFSATASDGTAATLPVTITFDWRGRATSVDAAAKTVTTFNVSNASGRTNGVTLSSWGDASVSSGDSGESSYSVAAAPANPTVTDVPAGTSINSSAQVP